jgi:mRNA interferase HigB
MLLCCVRVYSRSTLVRFVAGLAGHKDQGAVSAALNAWYHEVNRAEWQSSRDVKASYANASIVGSDRVVFNIKGNSYRLVVSVDYERQAVFVKWLGTHKDYDRIDVRAIQYVREAD